MKETNSFLVRRLTAAEYVLALHNQDDRVAVLVRNRARHGPPDESCSQKTLRVPPFRIGLKEQNDRWRRHLLRMNPLRANSFARTKESIREIRHVYLDLDEDAAASLRAIRTDSNTPVPNFVLDTSPEKHQVIWRVDGLDRDQAEVLFARLPRNSQAISQPRTFLGSCECLALLTANTTNNL